MSKIFILFSAAVLLSACSASTIRDVASDSAPAESDQALIESSLSDDGLATLEDLTATFEVYTFGTKRTFTLSKYFNQSSQVFIEADNPELIKIKQPQTTWGDFFETLPFSVTEDCLTTGDHQLYCSSETHQLKFFLNQVETPTVLNQIIKNNDNLVIKYQAN